MFVVVCLCVCVVVWYWCVGGGECMCMMSLVVGVLYDCLYVSVFCLYDV